MALFLARKLPVEVNNTPLVLNKLDLPSPFTTKEQLMLRVQNHYLNEVSRQVFFSLYLFMYLFIFSFLDLFSCCVGSF
jgi:hypothetical protein